MIYPSQYNLWLEREKRQIQYDIYFSSVFPEGQKVIAPQKEIITAYGGGSPELKQILANKYNMKPENVFITTGVSLLNTIIINTFCDKHNLVAVEKPRYEPLVSIPYTLGCTIVSMERKFEKDWYLNMPDVELGEPKMIVLTNPHNPTGTSLNKKNIEELIDFAEKNNSLILSDEVYNDCSFIKSTPIATLTKNAISVSHLNKSFGLGVLKIGWAISNKEIIKFLLLFWDKI